MHKEYSIKNAGSSILEVSKAGIAISTSFVKNGNARKREEGRQVNQDNGTKVKETITIF